MIRVAFWYDRPIEYTGGLNYIKNLLYALSLVNDKEIIPYVFFGTKVNQSIIEQFEAYAKVVQTSVLDRKSLFWFINKVFYKLFGLPIIANKVLKKHGISIVSHAQDLCGRNMPYSLISWIPDFQYLHLPELFPGLDIKAKTSSLQKIFCQSDIIVLSSYDALNDFKKIASTDCISKARVLQFVSQPNSRLLIQDSSDRMDAIEKKYKFKGKFFSLPNQFWQHKNHMTAFKAIKILKEKGKDVLLLCTGNLYDYRLNNRSYADSLLNFIEENELQNNIRILGLIDYDDVLCLMKNAVAILNPSRFEGWSSTVEEAKSIGKKIILSNINIHIEQNPQGGIYFNLSDPMALSKILLEVWESDSIASNAEQVKKARQVLHSRTLQYANSYISLLKELFVRM